MMYRVLIVDDEPWTIIGIKKTFMWKDEGFDIVADTTNPVEALDIIINEKPDVVFSDIRMPEISGLDLMKRTREAGLDTEFVLISGFAEFDYAKEAILYNVFDYCIKPINADKNKNLLKRLAEHLNNKRLKTDYNIFENLIENKMKIEEVFNNFGIHPVNKHYQVIVLYPDNTSYKNYFEAINCDYKIELRLGESKYLYIFNTNNDLYQDIISSDENTIKAGISNFGKSEDFVNLFVQADIAANRTFIYNENKTNRYKKSNKNIVNNLVKDIVLSIEKKDANKLTDLFKGLSNIFIEEELSLEDAVNFWNQLVAYITSKYQTELISDEFTFLNYQELSNNYENFNSLCEYCVVMLLSIIRIVPYTATQNENFNKLLAYINENYDKKIQLKDLANMFFININYCCELFKKNTNGTFSKYLMELRIQKAEQLLKNTNMSIEAISRKTGFNDYYYFNKSFKKFYGISPAKYRKQ